MNVLAPLFFWGVGLLILYAVIEAAVRRGVDSSRLHETIQRLEARIEEMQKPSDHE
ncbi:hypothetical protein [Priestia koreensis]|uniref:hypothetical protein n=1 Tax=Priestia koreensis TaxID=284581 RepID=UPI001F55E755|nr:hypothetical protein [Priestia koreensis]UNL83048.1 hypothetical protein IE339_12660 [Priestia koreensis]